MLDTMTTPSRRGFMQGGALASAAFATPVSMLVARGAAAAPVDAQGAQTATVASPYGPIAPVKCLTTGLTLLSLPKGFSYRSFSWTGDAMNDGQPTPGSHDGMAVVTSGTGRAAVDVLIRNHERGGGPLVQPKLADGVTPNPAAVYDPIQVNGGCTVLRVQAGKLVDHRATIGGTIVNCAGGNTLWNTWLTCEETTQDLTPLGGKKHGYVFETSANPAETVATPIVDMGRFSHEATEIDPVTGYIYLTEDARNNAGLYRYRPNSLVRAYGELAKGGVLEMARIVGVAKGNLIALAGARPSSVNAVGQSFAIEWVRVLNPDLSPYAIVEDGADNPVPGNPTVSGPYGQGREAGGIRFSRLEGIWWDRAEQAFVLVDTSFGYGGGVNPGRGAGAVWTYKPGRGADVDKGTLKLIYASANNQAGNNPDNVTVSPRGGVLLCEDGGNFVAQGQPMRLLGLTAKGEAYVFAFNQVNLSAAEAAGAGKDPALHTGDNRDNEFAGACFNARGNTLYVNIQTPGITFAITGPWARGNL